MTQHTLPTFLYVGAAKSGSQWLFEALLDHPDVFVPISKDLQFFETYHYHGTEWYLRHFEKGAGKQAIGELSHNYFKEPAIAQQIHDLLPNVKILCTLREPGSQLISAYNYDKTNDGRLKDVSFEELQTIDYYRHSVTYLRNLKPYFDLFPRENIKVMFFDDFTKDSSAFIKDVYTFLNVDPNHTPSILNDKINAARGPRIKQLVWVAYRVGALLRKLGLPNAVGAIKRNELFQRCLYSEINAPNKKSDFDVSALRKNLAATYEELEELIGRSLPENWPRENT